MLKRLRRVVVIAAVAATVALVVGIVAIARPMAGPASAGPDGLPYPEGCAAFAIAPRRCALIVESAARQAAIHLEEATEIRLLGPLPCDPGSWGCDGRLRLELRVRLVAPDRAPVHIEFTCGGGVGWMWNPLCVDEPPILISVPDPSGRGDIPCPGEPPDGCATPVPPPDPALVGLGVPLRVGSLKIPLDHEGDYNVALGTATLPNGVLAEASVELDEDLQADFLLEDSRVYLDLLDADGERMDFGYSHDWWEGNVQVTALLRFTVISIEPGAALYVRSVTVR